ncbi:MAG: DNA repair protein RecO [Oscillospiraceae bacterium]|nr:DNA repair protein RecO [Oscillospiraceae bacterium]
MYTKTEGIILRETEYRDSDKLLTVLTRDFGKLTVKARGVRSSRSRLKAACQLLTFSELTLFEQQGRYVITEAVPKEMFSGLRTDIELLSLASYFAQVTEAVAQEEDPMPELLSLLLNALYALAKLGESQPLVKAVFELRLCCIAGFLPDLRGCVICGRGDCDRFNITQGVLQCSGCSGPEVSGIRMPLSQGTLAAMRYITQADPRRLFAFRLSEAGLRELNGITEGYLCMRLERGFFTLDMYKQLFI